MKEPRVVSSFDLSLAPSGARLSARIEELGAGYRFVGVVTYADGSTGRTSYDHDTCVHAEATLETWSREQILADVAEPHVGREGAIELARTVVTGLADGHEDPEPSIREAIQLRLTTPRYKAPPFAPTDPRALAADLLATWRKLA